MDKIFEQTLLYDFYGELLNEHQRNVYEESVFNDLSLSEIADNYNISRQAAHDLLKRVSRMLEGYEEKLHMMARFRSTEKLADEITKLASEALSNKSRSETDLKLRKIKENAKKITEVMVKT